MQGRIGYPIDRCVTGIACLLVEILSWKNKKLWVGRLQSRVSSHSP